MISTRFGLVILTVIVLALGFVVATDSPATPAAVDRALVPNLDVDAISTLTWRYIDGSEVGISRPRRGRDWVWTNPAITARVETERVDAALTALRGARWHRVRRPAPPLPVATTLVVTAGTQVSTLVVGPAGGGQTWIGRDGEGVLVDDWVARALAPEPLALRARNPLDQVAGATQLFATRFQPARRTVTLDQFSRRIDVPDPYFVRPEHVLALHRAIAGIEIVAVPTGPVSRNPVFGISMVLAEPMQLQIHPACTVAAPCVCPAETHPVTGSSGPGCVPVAEVAAFERALAVFEGTPLELVDPRPVRFEPVDFNIGHNERVSFEKKPMVVAWPRQGPADPDLAMQLAAALQLPGVPVPRPPGKPIAERFVTDSALQYSALEIYPNNIVARRGEPVGIELAPGAWKVLTMEVEEFRDATLWVEEATAIRTITLREIPSAPTGRTLRGSVFTRGAVIGEWLEGGAVVPPGRAQLVERLVTLLASPRAAAHVKKPMARYQVIIDIAPFAPATPGVPSSATSHSIRIGDPTAQHCPVAGDVTIGSLLPRELCTLVATLLPLP